MPLPLGLKRNKFYKFASMKSLDNLVRKNILRLKPYSSARDEYQGKDAKVFLDANENPYNTPYNRYPDPLQRDLKEHLALIKKVPADRIFLGNGSDEAIDLMYRIFCEPGVDNVVAMEPTYGMYRVCADINNIEYRPVQTNVDFQPDVESMLKSADKNTKLLFFCSPNNPSGNLVKQELLEYALVYFPGIVVIDEAYIDFANRESLIHSLDRYPNMVVLQTFSKAWGCAGLRLGSAFAGTPIISLMNKVKYPYNVSLLTQRELLVQMKNHNKVEEWVETILSERSVLMESFSELDICQKVYPSDANFFLARVTDADKVYNYLVDNGIIVRNRSRITLCGDCLRVTIGQPEENRQLLASLRNIEQL